MMRTTILRSVAAAQTALRPTASATFKSIARSSRPTLAAAPRMAAWKAVRFYSAGGGLNKEEVEGRIMALLQGFDKVRFGAR